MRGDVPGKGGLSFAAGVAILAATVPVFVLEQVSIAAVNGWWLDELYTTWSTDSKLSFGRAFLTRFGRDHTPPLYYAVFYWVRHFVAVPAGQERIWQYIVSIGCILLASVAVVAVSRRAGLTGFGLAGVASFLLSGPVLEYAPEVRAYLMAMALVFVASWCAALAVERASPPLPVACWAALGILAALTHMYAALLCGGLAVGLLVLAAAGGRRDLKTPGLALGLSSACTFAAWALATAALRRWMAYGWIAFTLRGSLVALREVSRLEVGGLIALALTMALLAWAWVRPATRPLTTAFATAFAVFYILPVLVSFKTPVLYDRYWLIGGPALLVLLLFLARAGLSGGTHGRPQAAALALGLGSVGLLLASSVTGFTYARHRTAGKYIWAGARIVAPLAANCPAASIHVPSFAYLSAYAQVSQLPAALFVNANEAAPGSAVAGNNCPVLGWAEHNFDYGYYFTGATDADLLQLLRIDASPSQVDIRRQRVGYVVLRRNADGSSPAPSPQ